MFKKRLTNYVSELDVFLKTFDSIHPQPSASQAHEMAKHLKIVQLRDNKQEASKQDLWEKF
ncbi:MAG: hypothetical protein A3E87_09310 [Gammaproteobacteria bacterium RIFCSPHIGHO2_12_FULL_35_23]|nr:MAG: hypothetical protein A3E87_09310 [Gammaproteobacteria bacterium RIFCSPHIGHO2_12_FULL_35_23]